MRCSRGQVAAYERRGLQGGRTSSGGGDIHTNVPKGAGHCGALQGRCKQGEGSAGRPSDLQEWGGRGNGRGCWS